MLISHIFHLFIENLTDHADLSMSPNSEWYLSGLETREAHLTEKVSAPSRIGGYSVRLLSCYVCSNISCNLVPIGTSWWVIARHHNVFALFSCDRSRSKFAGPLPQHLTER